MPPRNTLWAALGVSQPVFQLHEAEKLSVSFILVNDGEREVDPHIESSHLFINGSEPRDWALVIGNGLRSSWFSALPPGKVLSFRYELGPRYFAMPGIYTLRWESADFRSPTVTFRVLPYRYSLP
jgi:hypothetical protein